MLKCKGCGEDADEFVVIKIDGKSQKLCSECAEQAEEQATVARESEAAVQNMMGYKGRR
jgi:ribosome-binding protein aMBF1 (putative translation factor)